MSESMESEPGGVEILLVEDDPDDRELSIRALRTSGLVNHIDVATDGANALEFLFGGGPGGSPPHVPKLILLDLKLPRVSGIEVLRRIKGDPELRAVPVVILTSSREARDLEECYALGANSYIVKPVDFKQFVESICSLGMYWLVLNEAQVGAAS
jgi:two-component system, response regulator